MSKPLKENKHSDQFEYISQLIIAARKRAYQSVNKELIGLYWKIGEYVSNKVAAAEWGSNTVQGLADFIKKSHPDIKGFTQRSLYRMKRFFEVYNSNQKLTTLLSKISWSAHLDILAKTKTIEEKEFYIKLAIKERLTVRELRRHLNTAYFERVILADKKSSTAINKLPQKVIGHFKDTYIFEFLNLPKIHSEKDLQKALLKHLKGFLLELGKDFSYLGEEYRLQVGLHDYAY